jgi:circadian clock protein KaiB
MTDLLNGGWFADDNGFDMHFSGARKRPVGETYAKSITPMSLKRRATAPPLPCFSTWKTSMNRQAADSPGYNLRLYIAGQTPKSIAAVCNLRKLCETYLSGRYRLDVIDLMEEPGRAQRDRIVAIPTLVRRIPGAVTRITGDLSNSERVLTRLNIEVGTKARRR